MMRTSCKRHPASTTTAQAPPQASSPVLDGRLCNQAVRSDDGNVTSLFGLLPTDQDWLHKTTILVGIVTKRFMARYPTVLQVGSTLFVHGGLLPQHAKLGLDAINRATQEWMSGEDPAKMPAFLGGRQAVVWSRTYSQEDAAQCDCDTLREALDLVPGAKRMVCGCFVYNCCMFEFSVLQVVGHTIQEAGINPACDEHVFRIDVGMSKGCGDSAPEGLEILDDKVVRRITEPPQRSGLAEALRQMLS